MKRSLLTAVLVPVLFGACATAGTPTVRDPATHPDLAKLDAKTRAMVEATEDRMLQLAVNGVWRDPKNVARDPYRHPLETLRFFGVRQHQHIIEITPGAGWYSEILSPLNGTNGEYVAAVWDDAIPGQPKYRYDLNKQLREKFAASPDVYRDPVVRVFDPKAPVFGPAGSSDVVLTFRNAHNWVSDGNAEAYFKAFFDVLKPGGILGVVDHRAKPGTDLETMKKSGYLTEALVIQLAKGAGFVLEARSGINANPKDTTDHPNGVWTLPPVNRHDAADDAKYKAIGESDRMTLRFRKPG